MVVHSENAKVNLTRILSEMRIDFEYQIIVANGEDFWEIMARESAKSDLVMIGLAPPKTEEDFETYYSRLKKLFTVTSDQSIGFSCSGHKI